jgi:hypothetical protein
VTLVTLEQAEVLSVAAVAATNASMADSWNVTSPTIAHPPLVSAFVKVLMNFAAAFARHVGSTWTAFETAFA